MKASATNPATATATATDDARDASWRGSNNYLTAMCAHPDAEIAAYAAEAKSLFDKYGDPTKLAQTEESGVLHNLLQDLEALDSNKRTALNLDVWITDLKTKEDAFLAAAAERTEADAARQVGIVKETRTASEAAYRSLVDTVNALAMIKDESVAEGVAMVKRELEKAMAAFGVTEIKALGKPFDPAYHEAILKVPCGQDSEMSGKVTEVFRKGYAIGDRVLRHSVVKVAE